MSQIVGGTSYHDDTPREVIEILETARIYHQERGPSEWPRYRFHYGDPETGQDWGDVHDVRGYVGRSMGPIKIPLLIANTRSTGGGALLDGNIIRIRPSAGGGPDLYRHPTYKPPSKTPSGLSGEALADYQERWEREFGEEANR